MMKIPSLRLLAAAACGLSAACITNPLEYGYRSAQSVPKRKWQNPNPSLVQPSMSGHNGSVSRYTSRGYRVIGYGSATARYQIDEQNARMLAMQKNADVAIFSRS